MKAKEFFETQLITDANSVIDKTKHKFTKHEVIKFAEEYSQLQTSVEISQKTKIEISKVIQDIADGKVHPSTGSARLMIILKQPNNKVDALIKKYEEYIELLSKDITNNAAYLLSHNIKSKQEDIKKGIQLRKEIQDLKQIK